ncbi:hypothetical protein O3P69_000582 [Scylla paramamosain]|uniref:Uncharacterized protein n=1 Tax=Scylla paramamosain TaxID=85552 RepID=A0AAW0UQT5_SCYPA
MALCRRHPEDSWEVREAMSLTERGLEWANLDGRGDASPPREPPLLRTTHPNTRWLSGSVLVLWLQCCEFEFGSWKFVGGRGICSTIPALPLSVSPCLCVAPALSAAALHNTGAGVM